METIELTYKGDQKFYVIVNGIRIDFRLHRFRDVIYADIWIDNEIIAYSVRCVPFGKLLPIQYESKVGNFFFQTTDDEYPTYDNLGVSCNFIHISETEIG